MNPGTPASFSGSFSSSYPMARYPLSRFSYTLYRDFIQDKTKESEQ